MAILILATSCAGQSTNGAKDDTLRQENDSEALAGLGDVLPPLPISKAAAAPISTKIDGIATYARSENAADEEMALNLQSSPDSPAWGMWALNPGTDILTDVDFYFYVEEGTTAWAAVSNYSKDRWEFVPISTPHMAIDLYSDQNLSPAGECYVAVIIVGGNTGIVSWLVMNTYAPGWHVVTVDSEGKSGDGSSLAVVDGNPAISYCDAEAHALRYVRASSKYGASADDWTTIVPIYGSAAKANSLAVVDGNPAIAFATYDTAGFPLAENFLFYKRSTTSTGSQASDWSLPYEVGFLDFELMQDVSLTVVAGNPAICMCYAQSVMYFHSPSVTGTDFWLGLTIVDDAMVGPKASLAAVDGHPAISYLVTQPDGTHIMYVRSASPAGLGSEDWNNVVDVDVADQFGDYTSLAVVDGNPAISYCDLNTGNLQFARSVTSSGAVASDWSQLVTMLTVNSVGQFSSLAIVIGRPAISFYDSTKSSLKFAQSSSASGSVPLAWNIVVTVDGADAEMVGTSTSLAEVNGRPAISYYDESNGALKYAVLIE